MLFGGGQLAWLWSQRLHFGTWVPASATICFFVLLVGLRLGGRWKQKYGLLLVLTGIMTIGPMVGAVIMRTHLGLTFEYDGLAKDEVAIDRLLHGQQIYGISWQGTQVDGYSYVFGGLETRHFNHLPLTVLAGVPIRLLTAAAGIPFDYRMVLIFFIVGGIAAITWLPATHQARFMVTCALMLNPALATIGVTGHDDIMYIVAVFAGLALLSRRQNVLACLAFGFSAALKPFGALAVPLALIILYRQWKQTAVFPRRQAILCLVTLAAPCVLSIVPFLFWNAGAFWRDVVLFTNGGIADAYPISGFGLSALLVALGIFRPSDYFPFGVLQLAALAPLFWIALRVLPIRPTLGRFVGFYTAAFFAFAFLARFFAHNYVATLVALACCVLPLAGIPFQSDELAPGRLHEMPTNDLSAA
ncbi:MAG: hypothetical protein QOH92_553 [Chloroflexota bacterium]|nr:hypothetical protein [Chloroflexota bacterium]